MNNRILFFGDSITWGAGDTESGWVTRLKKYTDKQAIDKQMENYNTVYNLGVSGDNTVDLLGRIEKEIISRIDEDPNLIIVIAIGINDSQFTMSNNENMVLISTFKSNLIKIIKIAKYNSKHVVLIGLTPVDESLMHPMPGEPTPGYSNENVEKYDNVLIKLAEENKLPFIDLFRYLSKKDYKKLLIDGLHPNSKGHELIYTKVLSELKSLDILE